MKITFSRELNELKSVAVEEIKAVPAIKRSPRIHCCKYILRNYINNNFVK